MATHTHASDCTNQYIKTDKCKCMCKIIQDLKKGLKKALILQSAIQTKEGKLTREDYIQFDKYVEEINCYGFDIKNHICCNSICFTDDYVETGLTFVIYG